MQRSALTTTRNSDAGALLAPRSRALLLGLLALGTAGMIAAWLLLGSVPPSPLAPVAILLACPVAFAIMAQRRAASLAGEVARLHTAQARAQREIASVAHDLKGPLSTVSSYLDLIAEGALGPVSEDTRAAAQRAARASARALTLVESALLQHVQSVATRPEAGDAVDLRALIRDVTEALRADIASSHAEITVEPLPRVLGDQAQLFRVFENLVQNAVKYARPGEAPMVMITGACEHGRAEIAVRDHGIGIPAEDCDRVFEDETRAGNASTLAAGHGLGLATVRQLVRDLGGEVWVDAASREGATVRLSLPLAA
ncbi:MAG: HAMP domain-containing sensor histidine kinase [Dehalococcoidia bacterium]